MDAATHWLVVEGEPTLRVPAEMAESARARLRGLLGRNGLRGVLLLRPARAVHTFGMRFAIDVAHLDGSMRVLRTTTMRPNRLGRVVWGAAQVIEAEAGSFAQWGLEGGTQVTIHAGEAEAAA